MFCQKCVTCMSFGIILHVQVMADHFKGPGVYFVQGLKCAEAIRGTWNIHQALLLKSD